MNPFEKVLIRYTSQPVPPHLAELFRITHKKELLKYIHAMQISKSDLVTLVYTCSQIGYHHFIEYGQWVPEHLKTSEDERHAFEKSGVGQLDGKAAKYISKISNTFIERKYRVGHLFVGKERWHLLFLELKDIKCDENHWVAGPHIHFTNDLCSRLEIDEVSKKFTALDFEMGERLHVRWVETKTD